MDISVNSERGKLKTGKRQLLNYRIDTLHFSGSMADDAVNSFFEQISANTLDWLEYDVKKKLEKESLSGTRRSRLDSSLPTYILSVNAESAGDGTYKVTIDSRLGSRNKTLTFLMRTEKKSPLFIRIKPKTKKFR